MVVGVCGDGDDCTFPRTLPSTTPLPVNTCDKVQNTCVDLSHIDAAAEVFWEEAEEVTCLFSEIICESQGK